MADEPRLETCAGRFHFVRAPDATSEFHLAYDGHRLELVRSGDAKGVHVELPEIQRRLRGQFLLGRACGIQKSRPQRVLDATAGLGIDGLALALTGQAVHLVEAHPILWALLDDLLKRLGSQVEETRLSLGDSLTLLAETSEHYDVIYFDPMFEPRAKTALPGKRMQYLAALLGEAVPLDEEVIELARQRATSRVVLKRRARDALLGRPDWTIRGKTVRYDVYRGRVRGPQPSSRMA